MAKAQSSAPGASQVPGAPPEFTAEEVVALQEGPAPAEKQPVPAAPPAAAQAADAFDVTLDEFCRRLSGADRRVEMIGAFHADEQRHGRLKDAEAVYRARYDAFISRPTKD